MKYSREQAIDSILQKNPECPQEILDSLALIDVQYFGFDGETHEGQIVVHQKHQKDIEDLFHFMQEQKFPLREVTPIVKYDWDDEASMSANNTSGFNFRFIINTEKISLHGYGFAIDINPKINPVIENGEVAQPANGSYNIEEPGTLYENHAVVKFMKELDWEWGGNWSHYQDYQHFQKNLNE